VAALVFIMKTSSPLSFPPIFYTARPTARSRRAPQLAMALLIHYQFLSRAVILILPDFCGTPGNPVTIGSAASQISAFQKQYQTSSPFNLSAPNANYIGTLLQQGLGPGTQAAMYNRDFETPRSLQMNIGLQQEIRRGVVLSVDFLRNVQTHYLLGIDENHAGDIRYFNKTGALQAISNTNYAFGCGTGTDFTSIQCAVNAGAQISDYASRGLASSADFGASCTGVFGYPCAFPGSKSKCAASPVPQLCWAFGL